MMSWHRNACARLLIGICLILVGTRSKTTAEPNGTIIAEHTDRVPRKSEQSLEILPSGDILLMYGAHPGAGDLDKASYVAADREWALRFGSDAGGNMIVQARDGTKPNNPETTGRRRLSQTRAQVCPGKRQGVPVRGRFEHTIDDRSERCCQARRVCRRVVHPFWNGQLRSERRRAVSQRVARSQVTRSRPSFNVTSFARPAIRR